MTWKRLLGEIIIGLVIAIVLTAAAAASVSQLPFVYQGL